MKEEENILFQYQVKSKTTMGTRYYYFYAKTDIENYLNNKNIKYVRYAKDTALNKQQKRILELFKENKQLETNWKELKKWLEENRFVYNITGEDLEEDYSITEVLNKMQEIEKSVSDEIFL